MHIRTAQEKDYPALREILLQSRRSRFHWANTEEMKLDDFDQQTVDEHIIVAEEGGHIAGFASLYLPENFLHHLFVHPDYFGRQIGGLLLNASIDLMTKPIRLKCVSANSIALSFYEQHGWVRIVEEEKHGDRYWIMEYR